MPGFYEGDPFFTGEITLSPKDLAKASLLAQRQKKPASRPWVRGGMLLTASLLFLAVIPYYQAVYNEFWFPLALCLLFLLLAVGAWAVLPRLEEEEEIRRFSTDGFRLEPARVCLYRDSFTLENAFQRFTENWVDFQNCYESREYFIVTGGKNYRLLVLPKAQLSQKQQEEAAFGLQQQFAFRYKKV